MLDVRIRSAADFVPGVMLSQAIFTTLLGIVKLAAKGERSSEWLADTEQDIATASNARRTKHVIVFTRL